MGKVKSAIITTLLVVAIVVLALFSTVSWPVSNTGTLNSFVSSIHLGSDLSGDVNVMLYPEGVISASDYDLIATGSTPTDKDKYEARGGVYVEKDKLADEKEFVASVENDAKVLSERFGQKGYSSYSVSVEDGGFAIKVAFPTNFTYSDLKRGASAGQEAGNTVQYLMLDGKLTIRNSSEYEGSSSVLPSVRDEASDLFKSVKVYSVAGNYYVRMAFTKEGIAKLKASITDDVTGYLFVGETGLNISIGSDALSSLSGNTLTLTASSKSGAEDYAILLSSVIESKLLKNKYNDSTANSSTTPIAVTPAFGKYAPVYLFGAILLVMCAAIVYSIVKYKKLGLVNALMVLAFSLAMVTAIMLIEIQVTIAGAFTAVLGLALMVFTNVRVFEAVRAETLTGKTISASIKSGYKKTLWTVLDLHIVLLVVSLLLTLVGVGEIASCGFIFFIATIASYVLYWFTRFIWYVTSSPAKDKFKFCGYDREAFDNDD